MQATPAKTEVTTRGAPLQLPPSLTCNMTVPVFVGPFARIVKAYVSFVAASNATAVRVTVPRLSSSI